MKRIIVLALAACMVLGAAFGASAADIKATGNFVINYDSVQYEEGTDDNAFRERFRSQIDIVTSENLSGTVYFEIGTLDWGDAGGAIGTDGTNVKTRYAYLDFAIPSTPVKVRAGLQALALPSATAGSPIIDDDVAAIVASAAFEPVSVTAFFARPQDDVIARYDAYGLIASGVVGPVNVSPYIMFADFNDYGVITAQNDADAFWFGVAADAAFGNLTVAVDAIYGDKNYDNGNTKDADGYFFAANAAYTLDVAKLAVLGWWSSDDDDVMPSIGAASNFSPLMLVGDTTLGISRGAAVYNSLGTQGIVVSASDVSFIEKLTHGVSLGYVALDNESTHVNPDDAAGIDGHIWEVDFTNTYAMYDNLDVFFEFAYASVDNDDNNTEDEDIFKYTAGVQYNF